MFEYFIFLSCQNEIQLNSIEMLEYIETIDFPDKDQKERIRNILKGSSTVTLQQFLNYLLEPYAKITVKKTPKNIIHSKRRFEKIDYKTDISQLGKLKYNALFIINIENKYPTRISYWELGYAVAKNYRVIGYRCDGAVAVTNNNLTYCMENKMTIENAAEFMTRIFDSLEEWGIKVPNPEFFENRWDNNWNVSNKRRGE